METVLRRTNVGVPKLYLDGPSQSSNLKTAAVGVTIPIMTCHVWPNHLSHNTPALEHVIDAVFLVFFFRERGARRLARRLLLRLPARDSAWDRQQGRPILVLDAWFQPHLAKDNVKLQEAKARVTYSNWSDQNVCMESSSLLCFCPDWRGHG